MRTAPKYLPTKQSQHLIGRFTTLKNHKDNDNFKDRTLIAFVGQGAYEFGTYNYRTGEKVMKKIDYGS